MLSSHDIDAFSFNEHRFSLAHTAALHGSLPVLKFLVKEAGLPYSALQIPDDSLTTPAMLAIQVRPIGNRHLIEMFMIFVYFFCCFFFLLRDVTWSVCSGSLRKVKCLWRSETLEEKHLCIMLPSMDK